VEALTCVLLSSLAGTFTNSSSSSRSRCQHHPRSVLRTGFYCVYAAWQDCCQMSLRGHSRTGPAAARCSTNATVRPLWASYITHCSTSSNVAASSNTSSSSSNTSSSSSSEAQGLQPAPAYQQLPPTFWDERRVLYNRMRHERDRANRRTRLQQLK
jgi:hypothetical protein